MTRMLIAAIAFSLLYLLELLAFGIGALKEGGGKGFFYCFLGVLLVLWAGFFTLRKTQFRFNTGFFLALGAVLSLWVLPAWRVEMATEERADRETTANLRRIQVSNVDDEPLLNFQGKPTGIRMRYSIQFPRAGFYPPAPLLTAADERFSPRFMRVIRSEITPHPEQTRTDPSNTGTYARYKEGVTYSFVVDLVPGFIIISPDHSKSCLSFSNADERTAITTNDTPTSFRVHIDGTDYGGYFGGPVQLTRNTYRLRDFYETAVASGAKDVCVFDSRGGIQ